MLARKGRSEVTVVIMADTSLVHEKMFEKNVHIDFRFLCGEHVYETLEFGTIEGMPRELYPRF